VLPWIQLTYNTTPRYGSSLSAYDVVFARHPRMPRSALLPPRAGVTGGATEDLLYLAQIATSLREAWSALRRANLEQAEWERELVSTTFNIGDQVLVLYNAGAKRRNKHYMAITPCTVTKVDNNDYDVYNNATLDQSASTGVFSTTCTCVSPGHVMEKFGSGRRSRQDVARTRRQGWRRCAGRGPGDEAYWTSRGLQPRRRAH
jgi:hypothetical protein